VKPYEKYKSTSIPWLPQVPEHWHEQPLRRLLQPVSIKNRPEMTLLSVERERGVIIRDREDTKSNHNFIPDDLSGYKFVQKDQFVINKMKAWQGSYGLSPIDGIVSPAYFVFDLLIEDKTFFSKAIRSKSYVPFFTSASDGIRVGQWDLDMDRMKNILFYIPPISESKQITRYLNWKVSQIVRLIKSKQKQIKLLEEQKRAVINNAVTRGINPDVELKESDVTWNKMIPLDWQVERIINNISFHKSGAWGSNSKNDEYDATCIRVADFDFKHHRILDKEYTIRNYTQTELSEKVLHINDLLIEKSGGGEKQPVGRVVLYDKDIFALCANFIDFIRPQHTVNPKYLEYLLSAMYYVGINYYYFNQTTGIQNLNVKGYLREKAAFPLIEEQNEIVNYIDKKFMELDVTIDAIKQEIALLQEYKISLISNVVTGQIDVRHIAVPETESIIIEDEEDEEEERIINEEVDADAY